MTVGDDKIKASNSNDFGSSSPSLVKKFEIIRNQLERREAWDRLFEAYITYDRKPDKKSSRAAFRALLKFCRMHDFSPSHAMLFAELARTDIDDEGAPPFRIIIKRRKPNKKMSARIDKERRADLKEMNEQKIFHKVALRLAVSGENLDDCYMFVANELYGAEDDNSSKIETIRKAWQKNVREYKNAGRDSITLWPNDIPVRVSFPPKGPKPKK